MKRYKINVSVKGSNKPMSSVGKLVGDYIIDNLEGILNPQIPGVYTTMKTILDGRKIDAPGDSYFHFWCDATDSSIINHRLDELIQNLKGLFAAPDNPNIEYSYEEF